MDSKTANIEALKLKHNRLLKEIDTSVIILEEFGKSERTIQLFKKKASEIFSECAEIENDISILGMSTH